MQPLWRKVEIVFAILQICIGVFLLSYFCWFFFEATEFLASLSGSSHAVEFLKLLGRAHPTLIFLLLIALAGMLLLRSNKFGWIGCLITFALTGISFILYFIFAPNYRNENMFPRDLIILFTALAFMIFGLLLTKEFRQKHKTTFKDWVISFGIIGFLVLDWFVLYLIR